MSADINTFNKSFNSIVCSWVSFVSRHKDSASIKMPLSFRKRNLSSIKMCLGVGATKYSFGRLPCMCRPKFECQLPGWSPKYTRIISEWTASHKTWALLDVVPIPLLPKMFGLRKHSTLFRVLAFSLSKMKLWEKHSSLWYLFLSAENENGLISFLELLWHST